jgi:hypothetical protein
MDVGKSLRHSRFIGLREDKKHTKSGARHARTGVVGRFLRLSLLDPNTDNGKASEHELDGNLQNSGIDRTCHLPEIAGVQVGLNA